MVGSYTDSSGTPHGTLYDGSTWHTLDFPGAVSTQMFGIDGDNIVGFYWDGGSNIYGFMVTAVPEPAAILLALLALALLPRRRRFRQ
jgi:MYXO-CTERM domain-containing protein